MKQEQLPRSPLSSPGPWNDVSQGYARTVKDDLAEYAKEAIPLGRLTSASHVLDVACGPGTLSVLAAPVVAKVTAIDFSREMLTIFRRWVAEKKISNVEIHEGDGQQLPFADNSFDTAFSMFGLMFFPDRLKGFAELYRTLKPGGRAVVSSWAPISRSPLMQTVFGAIQVMSAPAPAVTMPSPLEDPVFFRTEMEQAGFRNIDLKSVTKHFPVTSLDSFWQHATEGNARLLMTKNSMSPAEWLEKEKLALDFLKKTLPSLPTTLSSDAWIAIGEK